MRIDTDLVEGHLSHFLPARAVIVLRCSPVELERRLLRRGEPPAKARENAEAEALAVVAEEARREHRTVFELETSRRPAATVARDLEAILRGRGSRHLRRIDHSVEVMDWY
jgi:adenylate kinase